jgi:sugar phosphate isomerase/epimerase
VSPLIGPPREETERWLAESIAELLAVAEETDASVFLELHPQTPIPTVQALDRFVAGFDDPRLRVAYDVANAELVCEDQGEALRRLAPRLGQVHLSDASTTRWAHDRIGHGTVDFATVFRTLDEIAFDGACILEVVTATPLPDIEASMAALASDGPAKLPLVERGGKG